MRRTPFYNKEIALYLLLDLQLKGILPPQKFSAKIVKSFCGGTLLL